MECDPKRCFGVVGRETGPLKTYMLQPWGVCVWDTLHGKGDFAEVIKLRTLIWEDFPGLSSGPNTVTGSP